MSAIKTLVAEVRESKSKGEVRKLRSEGKVPAIIYGNQKPEVKVAVNERDFAVAYNKGGFFSRTIELEVGKEKIQVLPQEIQFDPVKDTPIHADFLRVDAKSKVRVSVPIQFANSEKSPGLKRGGVLNAVRRTVDVYCSVADIPEAFVADIGKLRIRDNIKFSELQVPAGVEPVINDRDFTIATIAGRVTKEEKEAQAAEDAAPEADA